MPNGKKKAGSKKEKDLNVVIHYKGRYFQLKPEEWQAVTELTGAAKSPAKAVVRDGKKVKYVPDVDAAAAGIGGYSTILNLDAVLGTK
jgi:hypothetical protein